MVLAAIVFTNQWQCYCLVIVQSLGHVPLFVTPWTIACQAFLSFIISWVCTNSSIESVMPASTISCPAACFSCPQSFPASRSFPRSQLFASGGQSTGVSASGAVLPMNIQDWFPLGCTGLISCSPRDSQESSLEPQFKSIISLALSFVYGPTVTSVLDY